MCEDFRIYRRRLPHWRLGGAVYFVTWRVRPGTPPLAEDERTVVLEAVIHHHGARYSVFACVVMDDHVHVVVHPMAQVSLTETVRRWKSYSANRLQRRFGRQGAVWQDEFFDRIIRDRKGFEETVRYVVDNPAERWPDQEEYRWLWVDGWW